MIKIPLFKNKSTNKLQEIHRPEGYLAFKTLPEGMSHGETVTMVQYEISGIQSFIFGSTDIKTTVAEISRNSSYVSRLTDSMLIWLQENFKENFKLLAKSSGKLICALDSSVEESIVVKKSDLLQRMVYATNMGNPEMHYGYGMAVITDNVDRCVKKYGSDFGPVGMTVAKRLSDNKYRNTNVIGFDMPGHFYPPFTMEKISNTDNDYKNDIYMAIKFDLDNLGRFFGSMQYFDVRDLASRTLNDIMENAFENVGNARLIFIGGDDIFAVTKAETAISDVAAMYKNIKDKVESLPTMEPYRESFGISGGVCEIRSDLGKVPIMYYFDESEKMLEKAKSVKGKNTICYMNVNMSWEQFNALAEITKKNRSLLFQNSNLNELIKDAIKLKTRILNIDKKMKILSSEQRRLIDDIC